MASKVGVSTLSSSSLEKAIKKTIYGKRKDIMDKYIVEGLSNSSGDNFSIPTVEVLASRSNLLKKDLIELYKKVMALDGYDGVSEDVMVLQASLFDGLVVGVNMAKDCELGIYTANIQAIFSTDDDNSFSLDKTLEMNRNGILNGVRIDVEYSDSEGFSFKPVKLNKNTNLQIYNEQTGEGRFLFVPYIAIQRSMSFFKESLDAKRVLEVTQMKDGSPKTRYITTRLDVLEAYSDNPAFVRGLSAEYFPLKCFFYAPVVGAPSFSTGVTRVNLIDISTIVSVSKQVLAKKVDKPTNGLSKMVTEECVRVALERLYASDVAKYEEVVRGIPSTTFDSVPSVGVFMSTYIRELTGAKYNKVINYLLENAGVNPKVLNSALEMYTKVEEVATPSSVGELREMLKYGTYRVVIRKKNCGYSSMVVTNDERYLESLYGDDYFAKMESFGVRVRKLVDMLADGEHLQAYFYCGIPCDERADEVIKLVREEGESALEKVMEIYSDLGKTKKSSSNTNTILARSCFSSDTKEYYKNIDINKIVSMYKLDN